ncbi:MAG: DivIVA domain-containing protein [Bacteroidota bacterium]
MKLSPLDIRKQQFKKLMRGYDPVEVDTFLEMVAQDMEEILKQMRDSREKEIHYETQLGDYKQIEKTLQQTLLQAQEVTGKTYESARREAELIVKEAESRAAAILDSGNRELSKLSNEISELKVRRESLVGRLRVLLSSELDLLKAMDTGGGESVDPSPSLGSGKDHLDVDAIMKSIEHDRTAQAH